MQVLPIGEADYKRLARLAQELEFFKSFTGAQLETVLSRLQLYGFQKGEKIFHKGDPPNAFFIISEGRVRIHLKTRFWGLIRKVTHLGEGQMFGEMSILENRPRSATANAAVPTKLFVLLRDDFEALVRHDPQFAATMRFIAEQRKFVTARS